MSLKSMPLYSTFWREFQERPTVIYFMVHPKGGFHFRDVVSLMEMSRVFPQGLTKVRFCPIIPGVTGVESPSPGDGIIILGRPSHFRSELIQKWITRDLFPPLQFHFTGNDPEEPGYRTIRCLLKVKDQDYTAPYGRESLSPPPLEDCALVYLGQVQIYEGEETSPCLILSGTSTLGTWGASVFATSPALVQKHAENSPWFQGVISTGLKLSVPDAPSFQRSNLALHVMDAFFRACWVKVVYSGRAAEKEWRKPMEGEENKFRVFINENLVATDSDTWRCFIALALEQQDRPGQFIQVREVEDRVRRAFAPVTLVGSRPSMNPGARLSEVAERLHQYGVYIEKTSAGYRLLLAGFEETVA
jgi:hypothetical protein